MWVPHEVHLANAILAIVGIGAVNWIYGIITRHHHIMEHIELREQKLYHKERIKKLFVRKFDQVSQA
jgi:hypothetical protein